jgi:hypothetical protein
MNCKEAQILMIAVGLSDPEVTKAERAVFDWHLLRCPGCAQEYRKTCILIELAGRQQPKQERARPLPKVGRRPISPREHSQLSNGAVSIEKGWEDLKRRVPELARLERFQKLLGLCRSVGFAAACLAVGVFAWVAFQADYGGRSGRGSAPMRHALRGRTPLTIELVSESGCVPVAAGQRIRTYGRELKTLRINGRHRMVMNHHTLLAVEPLPLHSRSGCMVRLASGEIFAHVEYDGSPFVVITAHGRAAITGTTFDVSTTAADTRLVVSEGTVQFASDKGSAAVTAGQRSDVAVGAAPSTPVFCDTTKLTAWAAGSRSLRSDHVDRPASDASELAALAFGTAAHFVSLEAIDSGVWFEDNRRWFEAEFPWIFELQDALAEAGIKVHYSELLVRSGDIWRFVYPEISPTRIAGPDFRSLVKTVHHYGLDEEWLRVHVSTAGIIADGHSQPAKAPGRLEAFRQWLQLFREAQGQPKALDSQTLLYSLHTSSHLMKTRMLVWFVMSSRERASRAEDAGEILAMLGRQVEAARVCYSSLVELLVEDWPSRLCCQYVDPAEEVIKKIEEMAQIEERILELEIGE